MHAFSWRVRRAALGLRQRDVADKARINQSRYSLLERDEAVPTEEEIEAINRALELSPEIDVLLAEVRRPRPEGTGESRQ
jgi:transcriptional regulator with XRE-family HTH domain